MGNTGDTGGDDHCHMELWIDGVRVDPAPYYDRDLPGTAPAPAGGKGAPEPKEWDEMASQDEIRAIVRQEVNGVRDAVKNAASRPDTSGRRTLHFRLDGPPEWTLGDPDIGHDLAEFTGAPPDETTRRRLDDGVAVFRGFMVTTDPEIGLAWARMYAKGQNNEHSRTDRAGYIAIQRELSRIATLTATPVADSQIQG
jgi:hypothetical protein